MKDLVRSKTRVKYESPTTYQSKIMTKVKVFVKKVKLKIRGSRSWYQMKGFARRNAHVKYESIITYQSNIMTKVKVFEKKVKLKCQRVKVMVSNGRSCQKE
jgi:hypothetical protein